MQQDETTKKTEWHHLAGMVLEETLPPDQMAVQSDFAITPEPSRGDILLLRLVDEMTDSLEARLPDGVNSSQASEMLFELKISESLNDKAFRQVVEYDISYRRHRGKTRDDQTIQCFLISAKTPQRAIRKAYNYYKTDTPGIYRSTDRFSVGRPSLCETIPLIVLNQLRPTANNAPLKFFASRQKQQEEALEMLAKLGWVNEALYWRLLAIHHKRITGEDMSNLNTAELEYMGRTLADSVVKRVSPASRLAGLSAGEVVPHFKAEEVVPYLKVEDRLSGLSAKDRLSGLSADDRLSGLSVEEVMPHFKLEDIWAGLSPEERLKLMELGRVN